MLDALGGVRLFTRTPFHPRRRVITVDVPPEWSWPWILQMGFAMMRRMLTGVKEHAGRLAQEGRTHVS